MKRTTAATPVAPATLRRLAGGAFAVFASLRLAIVLLSLFAACLAAASLLESRYNARVARELVYGAWWFALLLALLAANVLGAALKKCPWKRHQTGFLITHAGLLVLLAGGLLTALFGVEGQMVLVDTPSPALQARLGLSNRAEAIYLADSHRLEVFRLKRPAASEAGELVRLVEAIDRGEEAPEGARGGIAGRWAFSFHPGPFTWYADEHAAPQLPWHLNVLRRLAAPWPGAAWGLDGGATLTVDNFYPHTEHAPRGEGRFVPRHVPPGADAPAGLEPAVRCGLTAGGKQETFWVGMSRGAARVLLGDDLYLVRYRPDVRPVGFALTLHRARQAKGPGTDRPAWFQSDVSVAYPGGRAEEEHRIVMNSPLRAGPYKVYQANYRALADPRTNEPLLDGERPVSLSGLAVAHDPGLWLKYAGSLLVVLGIATMFYMRAYFFKPRARPATSRAA
jgi:hypothetical protein